MTKGEQRGLVFRLKSVDGEGEKWKWKRELLYGVVYRM